MSSLGVLKTFTAILGLVPVLTGLATMLGVHDPIYQGLGLPADPLLDSNLRFLGGVWLGLGLVVLWIVPRILSHVVLFRVAWLMIFLGGTGRLASLFLVGLPPVPFIAFTALEIIGAPAFVLWHNRLLRQQAASVVQERK